MDNDENGLSSTIAPFTADAYKKAMESKNEFCCGGNAAWINPFWSFSGMRLDWQDLDTIIADNYPNVDDAKYPGLLQVGVLGSRSPCDATMRGYLRMVSPEPHLHGLLAKVAAEITGGASHADLLKWSGIIKSVPMQFVTLRNHWDGPCT